MTYDCTEDVHKHITLVRQKLDDVMFNLTERQEKHDQSKLESPEKEGYDQMVPRLQDVEYGTQEYTDTLKEFKYVTEHHWNYNKHHPEHYVNGINDMSLLDLVEMLADWKVASSQTKKGNILRSIEIGRERFEISNQLYFILLNTVKELGWA